MAWKSLAEINSTDPVDMDEYHSRPDGRVKELVRKRPGDIVIYGARGKFSRHASLMLLRAVYETGTTDREVHLVSSPRLDEEFDNRIQPYSNFIRQHHIDLVSATEADLRHIPKDAPWVLYLAGYKFAKPGEGDEDYALKCDLYGMVIPSLVFTYHQKGANIVVMGSYNGLDKTPVDSPSGDNALLLPLPENHYGGSILSKERVIHGILKGRELRNPSKAVILRGGYYTDAGTYGGFEPEIFRIMNGQEINLGEKAYFNLLSHRDAAAATLLAVKLIDEGVSTFNLSGPIVNVHRASEIIAEELRKYPEYSGFQARFTGHPANTHLLADGTALEKRLGKPVDSIEDMIHAQVYWIVKGGYLRGLDHKIGKNI